MGVLPRQWMPYIGKLLQLETWALYAVALISVPFLCDDVWQAPQPVGGGGYDPPEPAADYRGALRRHRPHGAFGTSLVDQTLYRAYRAGRNVTRVPRVIWIYQLPRYPLRCVFAEACRQNKYATRRGCLQGDLPPGQEAIAKKQHMEGVRHAHEGQTAALDKHNHGASSTAGMRVNMQMDARRSRHGTD